MIWPGVRLFPDIYQREHDASLLRGFSFRQPYGSACIVGPKRDENRENPWPSTLGNRPAWICVHAGAGWYDGANDAILRWRSTASPTLRQPDLGAWPTAPRSRAEYPSRAILGFARVIGCVDYDHVVDCAAGRRFDAVWTQAVAATWLRTHAAWAFGPAVFRLDPTVLRLAVPLKINKGALGLWKLDGDKRVDLAPTTAEQVRAAFRACLADRSTWRTA